MLLTGSLSGLAIFLPQLPLALDLALKVLAKISVQYLIMRFG
jgi:hypothetical protein